MKELLLHTNLTLACTGVECLTSVTCFHHLSTGAFAHICQIQDKEGDVRVLLGRVVFRSAEVAAAG
jgi:hypothetical protein